MESCLQNPEQTIRTAGHVLRPDQLPRNIPTDHEPHVQRNEDAVPKRIIRLHGRYPSGHQRQPSVTLTDRPPSAGQTRGRILLPPTLQMRVRKGKNRLLGGRHQPRKDPHQPYQSRGVETMATQARNPQTSTINPGDPWIPTTLHSGFRPHRPTTHQPPKEGNHLSMDGRTHPSRQ